VTPGTNSSHRMWLVELIVSTMIPDMTASTAPEISRHASCGAPGPH
jgi:hypothetical protein